jgi:signal transduction histidine kinase
VRHNLFLTFEEALNNVLKHSGASGVQVEMTVTAAQFEVKITDNGHGFPAATRSETGMREVGKRGGNGLKNMRQRLFDIGGVCEISSQPAAGTTVTVRLPFNKKTDNGL